MTNEMNHFSLIKFNQFSNIRKGVRWTSGNICSLRMCHHAGRPTMDYCRKISSKYIAYYFIRKWILKVMKPQGHGAVLVSLLLVKICPLGINPNTSLTTFILNKNKILYQNRIFFLTLSKSFSIQSKWIFSNGSVVWIRIAFSHSHFANGLKGTPPKPLLIKTLEWI